MNLARPRAPQKIASTIDQYQAGKQASVRLDDDKCSSWRAVEQDLSKGWVLSPHQLKISAAVMHVALTRAEVDKYIMDALASYNIN